jgi:glycerol-3-phosphate cytidylyltransferase
VVGRVEEAMIKVFTLGVWDLLHIGHVRLLKEVKAMGDWLCVGIITDSMAERYKGRPIIPQQERMEMMLALGCVDEAIYHDRWEDNIDFLTLNGFSIVAVSQEHGSRNPLQYEVQRRLESAGIKCVATLRTPGVSSQIIKERIVEREKV